VVLPAQTSRRELISKFRALGWEGPRPGGRHQFMQNGKHKVRIPNPHQSDIGRSLLAEILKQANIDADTWLSA
jgi:predicted RNA binding protein YcfA (HicA-like mRNA interferase family)